MDIVIRRDDDMYDLDTTQDKPEKKKEVVPEPEKGDKVLNNIISLEEIWDEEVVGADVPI